MHNNNWRLELKLFMITTMESTPCTGMEPRRKFKNCLVNFFVVEWGRKRNEAENLSSGTFSLSTSLSSWTGSWNKGVSIYLWQRANTNYLGSPCSWDLFLHALCWRWTSRSGVIVIVVPTTVRDLLEQFHRVEFNPQVYSLLDGFPNHQKRVRLPVTTSIQSCDVYTSCCMMD